MGREKPTKRASPQTYKVTDVLDYMLEGCQIIGRDYRYLYVNDVVAAQGHSSKEDLIGSTMMERYPGIENTAVFSHLRDCMEHGTVQRLENEFKFPDGSNGWFELHMEPLPEGVIILSIDITERKQAEQRRHELDELKSRFIEVVSHQLRTPLTVMRWDLQKMSQSGDGLGKKQAELLNAIYRANVAVIERIGDMITALDIEEGRAVMHPETAAFEALWQPVRADLERACEDKPLRLTIHEPKSELPQLHCDGPKITGVLAKLISNAVMYTPADGAITVTLSHHSGRIRFEIEDTGIGIPIEEQPRVFSRFFRGAGAMLGNPDGSGLSLAVAKYYVQQHGGTIGFESTEHRGSQFWIELPSVAPTN